MVSKKTDPVSASFDDAQREMCHVYYHGALGVIIAGLVWLIAALVAIAKGPALAMWALFFVGICIFPLSVVLSRMLGRPGKHSAGNLLGPLAMTSTLWMIMCIPLAFGVALHRIEWFFPAMLLIIGGRYLTFATLYGGHSNWVLGATLGVAGWLLVTTSPGPVVCALVGAGIEIVFAGIVLELIRRARKGLADAL